MKGVERVNVCLFYSKTCTSNLALISLSFSTHVVTCPPEVAVLSVDRFLLGLKSTPMTMMMTMTLRRCFQLPWPR
jgi:hypothetical protein